ncbi:Uncharacterised protein [Helicobacter muridarum]|uniref:Uncharacterized protein n=1 Tax=Helicobacter muridarum TaxID=216 RepID=A0A377PSR4_9HELI|nr:Uncharacterised protein [Helicobacter muridarum]
MKHLDSIIKTIKAEFRQPYSKDREPLISPYL